MTRSLAVGFLLSASMVSADVGPRCNRQGGTILVSHGHDACNVTGDPNEIDPWNFNGTVAAPAGGAALYAGGWQVGATADFDHDGTCDLAWTLPGLDDVHVAVALSVNGEFTAPAASSQLMQRWELVGSSDYLGLDDAAGRPTSPDGRADLLFWNRDTGQLGAWATNALGGTPGALHTVAGRDLSWRPMVIANLDGNEVNTTSEIVWSQETTGLLVYTTLAWRNGTLLHRDGGPLVPEAPAAGGWSIRAADDFNGDGYEDLVFQHDDSQKAVVWFMRGPERLSGVFMQPDRLMPSCAMTAPEAEPRYDIVGPR